MRLRQLIQISCHSNDRSMGVGALGISDHSRNVCTAHLRKLELHEYDVELYFAQCKRRSLIPIGDRDRSTLQLFQKFFHDETRNRMIFANEDVKRSKCRHVVAERNS